MYHLAGDLLHADLHLAGFRIAEVYAQVLVLVAC